MPENLNKEREGRTDKVMKEKKKRKKERLLRNFCQCIHACLRYKKKKKKRKRISKLLILRRKESFRFSFFLCRVKKKNDWKQMLSPPTIHPTQTPPGRGKKLSGQERRKERSKEKWWMRDRFFGN